MAELSHSFGSFQYTVFSKKKPIQLSFCTSEVETFKSQVQKKPHIWKGAEGCAALTYLLRQEHVALGCWSIQPIQMKPKGRGGEEANGW